MESTEEPKLTNSIDQKENGPQQDQPQQQSMIEQQHSLQKNDKIENDSSNNLQMDKEDTSSTSSSSSRSSITTSSSSAITTTTNSIEQEQQPITSSSTALNNNLNSSSLSSTTTATSTATTTTTSTQQQPTTTIRKNTMACEMCNNYEMQLQEIQYREAVLNKQCQQYEIQIKKIKDDLKKEQTFRAELEEKYVDETKQFEIDIRQLSANVDNGKTLNEKLIIKFNKMEKKSNDLMNDLIYQIEQLKKELQRSHNDNEKLLCRHLKKSLELSSESISLPNDLESLQFYCLQLRENLIQALYNREHLEETLQSENIFLKEQLIGEQQSKEKIEENLLSENESLSKKLQQSQIELNDLSRQNNELKIEINLLKNNFNDLSLSSSTRITELNEKINELTAIKTKYESDISTLRAKVSSLQLDLDNSEQVQRDFVKLSQSLQVQLEKIRSSDTEVRWQHEDDISECNGCKKLFQSRKEKMNCAHCGRIFCHDCCSKQIRSGPKMRAHKVCQVCHTLLDNQTACWFVTEAPQSPT